jgi:hypothetical protein
MSGHRPFHVKSRAADEGATKRRERKACMKLNEESGNQGTADISRRTLLKSTTGIAGIAFILRPVMQAMGAQVSKAYDYSKKYLWDVKRVWNIGEELRTMRERMPQAGTPNFDLDRLINSPMGEALVLMFENFIKYTNEMDPELLKYYATLGKGLKKELFQADTYMERWSCYTPLSMYTSENKGRKYAFMFLLHGSNCSIEWEEANGFLPLAGRDEVIVVAPQNHSEPNLIRILNEVKNRHPVDESRIYSMGYSQGGGQTTQVTLKHPEIFAANAPCGNFPFNRASTTGFSNQNPITEEDVQNFRNYDLPTVIVAGQEEFLYIYPLNADATPPPSAARRMAMTAEAKIELMNRRLRAMRCPEHKPEEYLSLKASQDIVKRKIGVPFDRTSVEKIFGVDHYIGDFKNDRGETYLRMISIEGMPHWLHPTTAELTWKFMKRFSRDPMTKKLLVSGTP